MTPKCKTLDYCQCQCKRTDLDHRHRISMCDICQPAEKEQINTFYNEKRPLPKICDTCGAGVIVDSNNTYICIECSKCQPAEKEQECEIDCNIADRIIDHICKKEPADWEKEQQTEVPMGVSQWKEHGEKYGYWDYFEKACSVEYICGGLDENIKNNELTLFTGGCGKPVSESVAYRCIDCTASFHRDCLKKHFNYEDQTKISNLLQKQEERVRKETLARIHDKYCGKMDEKDAWFKIACKKLNPKKDD